MKIADPAVQHYWFGKAYGDVKRVILAAWAANRKSASEYWEKMKLADGEKLEKLFKCCFYFSASCSIVIFGTAVWLVTVPIHLACVLLIAIFVFTSYVIVDTLERLYLWTRGWRLFCKFCKQPAPLPEFKCGNCGRWHAKLRPSRYGVLFRRCICGQRLPSAYISHRNRLTARCPNPACHRPINAKREADSGNTIVAFVGAPSAGKSAYLTAAAAMLIESYGPSKGWKIAFTDPDDQETYRRLRQDISAHGSTFKTTDEQLPAFNFLVENSGGWSRRRQLFLCDVAGETFGAADKLAVQQQLSHATGVVFLLDPFSLPQVRAACEAELQQSRALSSVSRVNPADVLGHFVIGLEQHHNLKSDQVARFPLAVIVTKTDLCGLRRELTSDAVIRAWLKKWGATSFVTQAEFRFRKVQFFAASPLVQHRDGRLTLSSAGILEPLTWIFTESGDPLAPQPTRRHLSPATLTH